ncbi:uncharacterized protein mgarpb isoform X4 [Sphaeramia orbicularis]|uniref:uncharacterized protein mgarpb isoform X4 n=1 Tax=Sphaeramia orbicularis TaxID=375764 RepID=UPI001180AB5D|nr:uncharacterized protein LOC115428773 isoform X4 [Sphaeramia orbicularis]
MFCRRALQRIGPLARRALKPTSTNRESAPVRHMAFGVPGGSNNMMYFVLCGGGFTAALVYAYKTVSDDSVLHEDRVANMVSSEKAPAEAAPAEAAPAEAALAGERVPVEEVVAEVVTAPAEPVAETAAEPVIEVETKVAATEVPESAPTEAPTEALAVEEPSAPVTAEAVPEAASPGTMEVAALEETAPEAPAAESTEPMPDLLSAVKVLAGSPVEIAAASVGDHSLVEVIRQTERDKKGLDSTMAGLQKPDALEATEEEIVNKEASEGADVAVDKEVKPVEEVAEAEDAEALATKEVNTEETSAYSVEEKEAISIIEEPSAPTVEEVGEVDDVAPDTTSEEEASVVTAFPEEAFPVVDDITTITAEHTPGDEASVEEAATAAAEASSQETVEAALVGDKTQLAAASTGSSMEGLSTTAPESALEIPVEGVKHCLSCHSVFAEGKKVAPPAAVGEQLKGAVEFTHEAVTLEEGQTRELTVMIDQ